MDRSIFYDFWSSLSSASISVFYYHGNLRACIGIVWGGGRTQAFCRIQGHIWLLHRFKLVLVLGHRRLYYSWETPPLLTEKGIHKMISCQEMKIPSVFVLLYICPRKRKLVKAGQTLHLRKKWNIADDNGLSFFKNRTYLRASKWIFWAAFLKLAWDSSICAKADFAFLCKPRIVVLFIHRKKKRFFSLITNATNLRTIIGLHGHSHSFSCTCLLAMFGLW